MSGTNSAEKQLALPKASVKRIMKLSDEIQNVSAEAVVAVAKVTEDFLTKIIHQAHEEATKHNRKTVKVGVVVLFYFLHYFLHIVLLFFFPTSSLTLQSSALMLGGRHHRSDTNKQNTIRIFERSFWSITVTYIAQSPILS